MTAAAALAPSSRTGSRAVNPWRCDAAANQRKIVRNKPVQVGSSTTWAEISGGFYHSCARKTSGALYCFGYNVRGQLGNGSTTSRTKPTPVGTSLTWSSLDAGANHVCALKRDHRLYCWGSNDVGQIGDGTTIVRNKPTEI